MWYESCRPRLEGVAFAPADSSTRRFDPMRMLTLSVIFVFLTIIGCQPQDAAEPKRQPLIPPAPQSKDPEPAGAATVPQVSYAAVIDRAGPGVVTIQSSRRVRAPRQHPFLNDPLLRNFFGAPAPRRDPVQMGLGSCVIVRSDGFILTNHHVIDGAQEIRVELANRRGFTAKIIGSDPPSDLAVLKIEASVYPRFRWAIPIV